MKESAMQQRENASSLSKTGTARMRNGIKIIVTGALLLVATSAVAGLLSSPIMGGLYAYPELAPVDIENIGDSTVQISTTGLTGEFSLDASDVPLEFEPPASGCARLPFDQRLELVINLSLGVVEGHTSGRIDTPDGALDYRAEVRGNATCVPAGGSSCGQIIVDLETRGALSDANDPTRVGLIRTETLGSLLYGPDSAQWTNLTSNARLSGDAGLISSIISMEEGESCGI